MSEFKWTDELACEWAGFLESKMQFSSIKHIPQLLNEWKQSKQPKEEYTILSFKNKAGNIFRLKDGLYFADCWAGTDITGLTLSEALEPDSLPIHSVQRNSDNEVFSIGDEVGDMDEDTERYIDGFLLDYHGNSVWISTNKKKNYGVSLDIAKKVKQRVPLFTTEDGVEYLENDNRSYTIIQKSTLDIISDCNLTYNLPPDSDTWFIFSTRQKAEQYRLENKPIQVSYKEIESVLNNTYNYANVTYVAIQTFFKSKINNQ